MKKHRTNRVNKGHLKTFYPFLVILLLLTTTTCNKEEPEVVVVLNQTALIQNYIDIKYGAAMENIAEAERNIYHNEVLIDTRNVSDGYSEVLEGLNKGKYDFELRAGEKLDFRSVNIPNYLPSIDYDKWNSLPSDIEKNSEIKMSLKGVFYDKNVEDVNVPVVSARSKDSKTEVTLNGDSLKIAQVPDKFGLYQVEVEFGTPEGGLAKKVLSGELLGADEIVFYNSNTSNPNHWIDEIHSMKLDGSNSRLLTGDIDNNVDPAYSPDGSKIVFYSHRDGDTALFTMNADGSDPKRLTNDLSYAISPDWGVDNKIYFAYIGGGKQGIGKINPDGTGFESLYSEPKSGSICNGVSVSPDGAKVLFNSDKTRNSEIYIMGSDGTGLKNLTNHPSGDGMSAWSPDGDKIYFMSDRAGSFDIYSMRIEGSNVKQITFDAGDEYDPAVSPDGKKIVFTYDSYPEIPMSLYMMDVDGTNWKQVYSGLSRMADFKPN